MGSPSTVLIVPGLRDHVAEHWQTLLAARLPGAHSVPPMGREALDCAARVEAIEQALSAIDADIIKTYVSLGLGVGIVAQMAFDPEQDRTLRAIDCAHLFEPSTTRIGLHRNAWLRGYTYDFIEQFASALSREVVDQALGRG